ncbi:hypothetical protein RF11_15348 [Thelohanellus kitauei]|uniref:Uncharacterized protein n=1 Tax=Thelohanellus kitauei TaxID=669202 RepID=A0A0C2MEY4_THEKT|nr:hypothetical protein RF11_15348 [Thelohanellus kitauei]
MTKITYSVGKLSKQVSENWVKCYIVDDTQRIISTRSLTPKKSMGDSLYFDVILTLPINVREKYEDVLNRIDFMLTYRSNDPQPNGTKISLIEASPKAELISQANHVTNTH